MPLAVGCAKTQSAIRELSIFSVAGTEIDRGRLTICTSGDNFEVSGLHSACAAQWPPPCKEAFEGFFLLSNVGTCGLADGQRGFCCESPGLAHIRCRSELPVYRREGVMNRVLLFGIVLFLAVVGIALIGGEKTVIAGHGCHGCDGGCYGDDGCYGDCGGCNGRRARRHARRNGCYGYSNCCGVQVSCYGNGHHGHAQDSPSDMPPPPRGERAKPAPADEKPEASAPRPDSRSVVRYTARRVVYR
jgi:hypothetical protein